jgi:glycerol kinase
MSAQERAMTAAPPFVLAIDQGTTSSRAILFDRDANQQSVAQIPVALRFPQPGWVNQDADDIWRSTLATAQQVVADAGGAANVAAIGIANQRETTILWDRRTGRPVAPAIVWQSRQSADLVDAIVARGMAETYQRITGLVPDAYFSATKIAWLLAADSVLRRRAESGDILFGTVDSWLIWNLTGGRLHVTDVTNASRTMLFDLARLEWSELLLADLDIPHAMLPEIVPNSGVIAEIDPHLFGRALPIAGSAGDQQAALFGQACIDPGQAKNTYGTGSFLLMNVGQTPPVSHHRLLATPAWQIGGRTTYALEGAIFVTGAAVQWLRDGLGIIPDAAAVEPLAASVPNSDGVVFVPALTGLGAPDWDPHARGAIFGITRGTTAAHIARATLDAIAHQTRDVLEAMVVDSNFPLTELRVDGGAARDDLLLQIQADLIGVPVIRPRNVETTALGAAYLAGLAAAIWRSKSDIAAQWHVDRVFEPSISADERETRHARWRRAVARSLDWAE